MWESLHELNIESVDNYSIIHVAFSFLFPIFLLPFLYFFSLDAQQRCFSEPRRAHLR